MYVDVNAHDALVMYNARDVCFIWHTQPNKQQKWQRNAIWSNIQQQINKTNGQWKQQWNMQRKFQQHKQRKPQHKNNKNKRNTTLQLMWMYSDACIVH